MNGFCSVLIHVDRNTTLSHPEAKVAAVISGRDVAWNHLVLKNRLLEHSLRHHTDSDDSKNVIQKTNRKDIYIMKH